MFIVTNESNVIILYGNHKDEDNAGNMRITKEDGTKVSFAPDFAVAHEISNIPDYVEVEKYCYTAEQGFYLNPDWVESDPTNTYGIPDETYHQILDDYTLQLIEEGAIS